LFFLADHFGILADDRAGIDQQALVAFGPAVHLLFEDAPVVVVEFGVLWAHVGHVEALLHRGLVPSHVHRWGHVSTAVAAAAIFPIVGAGLDSGIPGIVVVLTVLVARGIGHIDHSGRQFVGDTVGNAQCGVEVDPDGLVVDDLIGDSPGDAHCQRGIGALLLNGSGRSGLADGGDGCQGRDGVAGVAGLAGLAGVTGVTGVAGGRRKILRLY